MIKEINITKYVVDGIEYDTLKAAQAANKKYELKENLHTFICTKNHLNTILQSHHYKLKELDSLYKEIIKLTDELPYNIFTNHLLAGKDMDMLHQDNEFISITSIGTLGYGMLSLTANHEGTPGKTDYEKNHVGKNKDLINFYKYLIKLRYKSAIDFNKECKHQVKICDENIARLKSQLY